MNNNYLITVFTPTYNRADLLPHLFNSLRHQTYSDFEWVIVDDGSTDNTQEVVNDMLCDNDNQFSINYIRKENHGKHTAINMGVRHAKGELFMIVDSDDMLPDKALEIVADEYQYIKNDNTYCGVCGYMAHSDGRIIGHGCDVDYLSSNSIDINLSIYHFGY